MEMVIRDLDGGSLEKKLTLILNNIREDISVYTQLLNYAELSPFLIKSYFIFYKIGLGTRYYQELIRLGNWPSGYEFLSSYLLDRFLSKYHMNLDEKIKLLLLKTIVSYPSYIQRNYVGSLEYIPDKVYYLDETINIMEMLSLKYLGFKPVCRVIMKRELKKTILIRWHRNLLSEGEPNKYILYRDWINRKLEYLMKLIISIEEESGNHCK